MQFPENPPAQSICNPRKILCDNFAKGIHSIKNSRLTDFIFSGSVQRTEAFIRRIKAGGLVLKEHMNAKWLTKETLYNVDWLPADEGVIGKIEKTLFVREIG